MREERGDEQRRMSRDRLRSGFLAQSVRQLREWSGLLAQGADPTVVDAVVHELERMSETARTFQIEGLTGAAEQASRAVATGGGRDALRPAASAVRDAGGHSRFPPIQIVARDGALDRMRVEASRCCEAVQFFESVEAMRADLRCEDPQAVVVPYEDLHLLSDEDRRFPLVVYGPGDFEARADAATRGVMTFLPDRVEFRALLERVRWQTWLRRAPTPRALLVGLPDEIAAGLESHGVASRIEVTATSGVLALGESCPDVVVTGPSAEICRVVRGHPRYADLTLVGLAGSDDAAALLEAGFDGVLDPALPAAELSRRLAAMVGRARQRSTARDIATGLLNRPVTLRAVDRAVSEARRGKGTLAVSVVEPDGVDTKRSDAALRLIGRCFEGAVRANDVVGRMGGETFLVLFPGCNADQARRRLTDIRSLFQQLAAKDERVAGTTFSTGTADSDDGCDRLLLRAEEALERVRARDARGAVG